MSDLEKKIREELRSMNGDYDEGQEGMLREVVLSSFKGRLRTASILVWVVMLTFAAAAVFCSAGVQLAETTSEMILFGAFLVVSVNVIMVVKLWYWMLANRNAVQRDVRRLEARLLRAMAGTED